MRLVTEVLIVKASDAMYWYANHIGERFKVWRNDSDRYWVREPSGYLNFVLHDDAKVEQEWRSDGPEKGNEDES